MNISAYRADYLPLLGQLMDQMKLPQIINEEVTRPNSQAIVDAGTVISGMILNLLSVTKAIPSFYLVNIVSPDISLIMQYIYQFRNRQYLIVSFGNRNNSGKIRTFKACSISCKLRFRFII
jgi:hypothetical protein